MALGAVHAKLRSQTVLQQLLEEINFQRTKEMRQLLKDDGGFVVLQGTTYWTDLFVRHFLFQSEPDHSIDSDDLLFFVRKKHVKSSSRHMPKYETEVDVFRKDSRKLPIGDPDVDWEETVYLNLIIHQFNYTLTLAICTRTSPKELQVLRRHSQRVYASPSRRKMDTKGDGEEMTYPHICFMVDNFDEVFSDIMVRDGEMVCVELVASDRDGSVQGVIFLGSIRYDALKKVYDARQSSLSSKVAQRMTFGLFNSGGPQTRCEFVRMKGPQGKGHAEMAVTKPKGSGVETPTSEPGFCATDMDEWDEDPDDYYNYRHQRRLSDPSANLNNYSRYGWKTKSSAQGADGSAGTKARSENEGLDSLASEVSEIEAGDLKDDRPASSASETKLAVVTTPSATCCTCFGPKKRWSDSASGQMSDVYCRVCENENDFASPACLANITPKRSASQLKNRKNLLNVESVLELPTGKELNLKSNTKSATAGDDVTKLGNKSSNHLKSNKDKKKKSIKAAIICKEKEKNKLGKKSAPQQKEKKSISTDRLSGKNNNKKIEECEYADDATSFNGGDLSKDVVKMGIVNEIESKLMIRVHGIEELPASHTTSSDVSTENANNIVESNLNVKNKNPSKTSINSCSNNIEIKENLCQKSDQAVDGAAAVATANDDNNKKISKPNEMILKKEPSVKLRKSLSRIDVIGGGGDLIDNNGNKNGAGNTSNNINNNNNNKQNRQYSTLPKMKKNSLQHQQQLQQNRQIKQFPMRTTADGTNIYYWCDVPKKTLKELDDGAYNPLWATRGFTQTFHFWKEHRRQQSTPLNAFLTYVTLPWWSIAKDLLDIRETPILTF